MRIDSPYQVLAPIRHSADNPVARHAIGKAQLATVRYGLRLLELQLRLNTRFAGISAEIWLTNLLRQHIPFELGKVFHSPYVVSPSCTLFSTNRLCVQHLRYRPCHMFGLKFNPALGVMYLFRSRVLFAKVCAFRIYKNIRCDNIASVIQ
jgi:hypothetical protein